MKKTISFLLILACSGVTLSRSADIDFDGARRIDFKAASAQSGIPVPAPAYICAMKGGDGTCANPVRGSVSSDLATVYTWINSKVCHCGVYAESEFPGAASGSTASASAQIYPPAAETRGETQINMQITYPTKRGIAASDPKNGIAVNVELPAVDPDSETLCYLLDAKYNGSKLQATIESGHINWRYFDNLKTGDIELEMSSANSSGDYYGEITGETMLPNGYEKVSMRIARSDSYSRVYTVTGNGISVTIQSGTMKGTIRQGAYQDRTVAAILSLVLMLRLQ